MLKSLSRLFFSIFVLIPNIAYSSEVEGTIRSEHLVRYQYDPPPTDWAEKGIKEKARLGCQHAFEKLNEENEEFECEELRVGTGPASSIYYKIVPIDDGPLQIPYLPPTKSPVILGWYHFRKDGKLPYYKENVFTKNWIQTQYESINLGEDFDSLYVIPVVSVIDSTNDVSLYIVSRSDTSLRLSSWILRSAFSLFESPEDKLQSELCLLMQKVRLAGSPKKLQTRLEEVESELENLKIIA